MLSNVKEEIDRYYPLLLSAKSGLLKMLDLVDGETSNNVSTFSDVRDVLPSSIGSIASSKTGSSSWDVIGLLK